MFGHKAAEDRRSPRREAFGVRRQSAAATALSDDAACSFQSGVALRLPPQSKSFASAL